MPNLPTTITPGFPGHIGDHEEMHSFLDDWDSTNGFALPQWKSGSLGNRPAAGVAGRVYFATDIPLLFFDTGAAWQAIGTRVETGRAACTITTTLTQANQDVPGAQVVHNTVLANAIYEVWGIFDFEVAVLGGQENIGEMLVNGAAQSSQAIHDGGIAEDRATVAQCWRGTLASPGDATFKLQARKNAAGGTVTVQAVHTVIMATVIEGNVS